MTDEKEVCLVEIEQSDRPVYLKSERGEEFYIRTGNATDPMNMSEADKYKYSHWRK